MNSNDVAVGVAIGVFAMLALYVIAGVNFDSGVYSCLKETDARCVGKIVQQDTK